MKQYSEKELKSALKKVGIKKNSTILIHSALHVLGKMKNSTNAHIPKKIYSCIKKYLGSKGTIVVPAFFYNYARKRKFFDLSKSPPCKSLGIFSQYIYKNQKFIRSKNPITSLAAVGHEANKICKKSNSRPYGFNSAWDRLTNLNSTILFLGVPLRKSLTYIHFIEFLAGVPHMYIKKINIPIKENGKVIEKNALIYVRYLDYNIKVNLTKFENDLKKEGLLKSKKLGSGYVSAIKCKDILTFALKKIIKNSSYFLNRPPSFRTNNYPLR
tara:strand:- start:181 stop:990 length:810 start_codon:yes stop_codon:yes gene_type:complete